MLQTRKKSSLGRKSISLLYSIFWNKNITKGNKKRIYNFIVKSITSYSSEIGPQKDRVERMLKLTFGGKWPEGPEEREQRTSA